MNSQQHHQVGPPQDPSIGFSTPLATAPPLVNEPPPPYGDFPQNPDPSKTYNGPGMVYPPLPPLPNQVPPNYPQQYPQQPRSAPQPGHPPHPVNTVYVGSLAFSARPQQMTCPHCTMEMVTKVSSKAGLLTYLLCGGLAFFGCWLCCCIPFCVESAQDVEHHCPKCERFLGTYKRI